MKHELSGFWSRRITDEHRLVYQVNESELSIVTCRFYIILFLLSFTLTYLIKNYAIKKSLVAHVNERSSHTVPTPHGGGIAVSLTWFLGLVYLYFYDQIEPPLLSLVSLYLRLD